MVSYSFLRRRNERACSRLDVERIYRFAPFGRCVKERYSSLQRAGRFSSSSPVGFRVVRRVRSRKPSPLWGARRLDILFFWLYTRRRFLSRERKLALLTTALLKSAATTDLRRMYSARQLHAHAGTLRVNCQESFGRALSGLLRRNRVFVSSMAALTRGRAQQLVQLHRNGAGKRSGAPLTSNPLSLRLGSGLCWWPLPG